MALDPSQGDLRRVSVQLTEEQITWLTARAQRLGIRSLASAVRMALQEMMNAEYRATTTDTDTEQGGG